METVVKIITFLYAGTGLIATIGYLPTIRDLTRKIASADISSYAIWTFCSCTAFLYALLVNSDLLFQIVTGLNFASCAVILFLALKLKYKRTL